MLADNGYFSEANVEACAAAGIEPLIAMNRDRHHPSLNERFAEAPPAPEDPTPAEAMAHRLRTPEGKKLYAKRKCTPEPVFGIIKSVLGFRQFLLRGLDNVRAEWSLVTMAWNVKRMFALKPVLSRRFSPSNMRMASDDASSLRSRGGCKGAAGTTAGYEKGNGLPHPSPTGC